MVKSKKNHTKTLNGVSEPIQLMSFEAKFKLALDLIQNKKTTDAKILFNEILFADSRHAESWFYSALIAEKEGSPQDAIRYLETALEIDPQNLKYLYTIGDFYYEQNYLDQGIKIFENIIKIQPDDCNGYYNLANCLQKQKKYDQAILNFQKVLELDDKNINAIYNLGNVLIDIKRYEYAMQCFTKVNELQPNSDDTLNNLGFIQLEFGYHEKALEFLNQAISINPNNISALNNLGKVHEEISLYLDALGYFDNAIRLKPNYVESYSNRGVVSKNLNRFELAIIDYDTAIHLDPENPDAYYNKAILLLQLQQFSVGWDLYQWRWKIKIEFSKKLDTKIPYWNRQNSNSQSRIILWAEQGIGDEIFYFGMLKNFSDIDARVTVSADTRLHALFKRSIPELEFIDKNEISNICNEANFDFQAPIGDIGQLFSVDKSLEHKTPKPFLQINQSRCWDIKNKNSFLSGKFVCGISWKSTNKDIGIAKSLNLIDLSPLLSIENVVFISLQYGSTADEIEFVEKNIGIKIHTIDGLDIFNDIDGLVSLISLCDLVVTTSNITAHLTGAIGKKGMVLMPFSKGKIWYWHSGVGPSLWYPSLEMVSQLHMNEWTDPINKCKEWVLGQL
jgi:tetratricopeptide (TPR) repeat protein